MSVTAAIFPIAKMEDATVDQVVSAALQTGLVACNAMTGPFRICFFPKGRVPKGWSVMGLSIKPKGVSCAG